MRIKRKPSRRSVGNVRSEHSQLAIMEAAQSLLLEQGFDDFSVEGVARKARSSKPTIYKWWGNKTKLAYDVYAKTVAVKATRSDEQEALVARITNFYVELWDIWSKPEYAALSRKLLVDSQLNEGSRTDYRDAYFSRRLEPLIDLVREGIDKKELPEVDIELVADILSGFHMLMLLLDKKPDLERIRDMVEIVLCGVSCAQKT